MNALRRFRWPIPRFSLSNLLMLMVVVGLALAWYDQRRKLGEQTEVVEKQRLEIARLTVNNVLRQAVSDPEKAVELQRYVKLLEPIAEFDRRFGVRAYEQVMGENILQIRYQDCDLVVGCDAKGIVNELGYLKTHTGEDPLDRCGEYKPLAWVASTGSLSSVKSRETNNSP